MRTISIVIPYMHTEDRYPLLLECLKHLPERDDVEICVHETGKRGHLQLGPKFRYRFTEYTGVMHRGWALNSGVRELSTGGKLVLLDADIVVTPSWIEEIEACRRPSVAWGRMLCLDAESTRRFLEGKNGPRTCQDVKTPRINRAAGGVTCVDRDTFYRLKGLPEDFEGTWGGEDNTFLAKLRAFGHPFRHFKCDVFHLQHRRSTPKIRRSRVMARRMLKWPRSTWETELNRIGDDWGRCPESKQA